MKVNMETIIKILISIMIASTLLSIIPFLPPFYKSEYAELITTLLLSIGLVCLVCLGIYYVWTELFKK